MNTKNTILLLVVALLIGGAIYYTKQKEEQTFTSAAIPEKTIPTVTSGTIERIVIEAPHADPVTLTKADGEWYTNVEKRHEAETGAVNAAIRALEQPISAKVVSTNADSYDNYLVSDTSGTKVQVFEKGKQEPTVAMIVGKDTAQAFSTYIRLDGEKEVLNAKASLSMAFKRPDGWRDKKIFNFSGGLATRIEARGSSATFTVVKDGEETWRFEGEPGGEAELARVNSMANMLGNLRANGFVEVDAAEPPSSFGLSPARQTIALAYDDKTTSPSTPTSVTLLIGNEVGSSGEWYARRGDSDDIFTIGAPVAEALSPDPESIKVPEPVAEPEVVVEPEGAPEPEGATDETTGSEQMGQTDGETTAAAVSETNETMPADTETTSTDRVTSPAL